MVETKENIKDVLEMDRVVRTCSRMDQCQMKVTEALISRK
jgi:hypothetical protein